MQEEQTIQQQVPAGDPPAKRKLYDNLYKTQLFTKSYDEFEKKYSTPEAIGTLYDGLSSMELYTKSREDFDKQYFAPPPQEPPAPVEVPTVDTIRQLQTQADTIPQDVKTVTNMAGDSLTMVPDTTGAQKQKESQAALVDKVTQTAKDWGVDKDYLKDAIKNFPHYSDEGIKKMAKLADTDPVKYGRLVYGSDLQNRIAKSKPPEDVVRSSYGLSSIGAANKINQLSDVHSVAELMQNAPIQQDMINVYTVGDAIARKTSHDDLRNAQSPLINTMDETVTEEYNKSGFQGVLNKMQFAGLLTEKIFDPQQYDEDVKMLQYLGSENGQRDSKDGTYDFKRGREQVLYKLYAQGKDNNKRAFSSRKKDIDNQLAELVPQVQAKIDGAKTPEEQQSYIDEFNTHPLAGEMQRILGEEENLKNAEGTEDQNYPMRATDAAHRMVEEALDQDGEGMWSANKKFAKRFPALIGKSAEDTYQWAKTAFINLLANREAQANLKLETIGSSKSGENQFFQPQSYTGIERPFNFSKPTIKKIQEIFNSDIPDAKKEGEAMKFLRDNQDGITVNSHAGEHNWSFKAGVSASTDMIAMIAGMAGQSMLMGNLVGGAGKIKNLVTSFTPMYMSMQNDLYGKAVANGENDPYLKTSAEAAIVSLAGLINPPAKILRGMLSKNKVVGKVIAGMDDQTIQNVITKNKKWVSQIGEFGKGTAKQLGLASAQYGLVAPLAQTTFQRNFLGEDVDFKKSMIDGTLHTLVSMSIPALFHGVQSVRAANVSPMQRLSIYEAALNSKNRLEFIDLHEKSGQLSEVQAHQMRTVIERAAKALKELPPGDKKMTEQKRADILYNMVRKEALKGRLKDAKTDLHKSNIESKIAEIDAENADIKKGNVSPVKKEASSAVESFTTESGSEYVVHEDGTTTRNKAQRLAHGDDFGMKDKSGMTVYVSPDEVHRAQAIYAEGHEAQDVFVSKDGTKMMVRKLMPSGENKDFEFNVSKEPKAGLHPFEITKVEGGKSFHVGSAIKEVKTKGEATSKAETKVDLSPEEQKVIQAIQDTMKDSKNMVGQKMYEASSDPARQKEIIQQLNDQSVDPDAFLDTFGVDVLDAVYQMQEKTGKESPYKTNEQLHVDLDEKVSSLDVAEKPRHTVSQAGVRNIKIKEGVEADLSQEPVSQFEGQPLKEAQPFVSKNGHTVKLENGELTFTNKKGQPLKDRETIKKAKAEYAEAFDYTRGEGAPVPPEGLNHREIAHHVIETSKNPAEIAEIYIGEEPGLHLSSVEEIIAREGIGKITRGSYKNEGDKNNIGQSKALTYFHKDGQTIDQVALEISGRSGKEITVQDIVDFIDRFPNGSAEALKLKKSDVAHAAEAKFKALTGLDLDANIAEKAVKSEFRNLEIAEQQLAQHEYETAEQLQKAYEESLNDGSKDGNNKSNEPQAETKAAEPVPDGELIGITHAELDAVARDLGLPEYEKSPEKEAEWIEAARKEVAAGKMPDLIEKLRKGDPPNEVETKMMAIYAAHLKAKVNGDPKNDAFLSDFNRFKQLSDIAGRTQGKAFRARQGLMPVEETVADFLTRNMEETNVDKLTDKQKEDNIRENEVITDLKEKDEAKMAKLEEEYDNANAERKVKEQAKKAKKNKTHEQYVADRKTLKEQLRTAKLVHEQKMKDMGIQKQGIAPTLTGDMIKIIGKIIGSHVDEGVQNLAQLIKKAKVDIQEHFPDITDEDIRGIFTGEYNEKKTKNQLMSKRYELMMEAKLQKKLEDLLENGKKAKTEKQQRIYNKEITALKDKISALEKELAKEERENKAPKTQEEKEASALKAIKTSTQKQLDHINEQLKSGNFTEDVKKKIKLDKEAREIKDKLMDAKIQRETRILREKYQNQTRLEKSGQFGMELANLTRTIMSSTDLSAPFRQGLVALVAHPIVGVKAFGKMLHAAVSQKQVDRFFYDLRNSEDFHLMQESGLGVTDPLDPKLTAKEEAFMNNIAQKIPIAGGIIKGSERAYVMFLNKMRVDVFRMNAKAFELSGKTMENSPQLYKSLADHINNITGRGRLPHFAEGIAPTLNAVLFSPRLIASRLNLLTNFMNPRWYRKTPPEIRAMYFKDMAAFTVAGVALMGLSKLAFGDDLETDPRSTDFLKYKSGKERIDVLGGFQQYLRVIAQFAYGEKMRDGKIKKLDGKGAFGEDRIDMLERFGRGKLAPNAALLTDIIAGSDMMGNDIDIKKLSQKGDDKGIAELAGTYLLPMTATDITRVFQEKSMRSVGLLALAVTGASVQSFDRTQKTSAPTKLAKTRNVRRKRGSGK